MYLGLKCPIQSKLNCAVLMCKKKKVRKTDLNVLWHSTGLPSGLSVFSFVSSVCFLVRVNVVDKTGLSFAVC